MLRYRSSKRNHRHNINLGWSTAAAAGMVNVASVMAFFAFTSNVTGHFAIFGEQFARGQWHQTLVVFSWLVLYFMGAFLANFLVNSFPNKSHYVSHSIPVGLEVAALTAVAVYGHNFYNETLRETEALIGTLLFAMGTQNGLVATISAGKVKTTHLTGLLTDLGIEVSQWMDPKKRKDRSLKQRLQLRWAIMGAYVVGGITGGYLFLVIDFWVFYIVSAIMLAVLYAEVSILYTKKALGKIRRKNLAAKAEAEAAKGK